MGDRESDFRRWLKVPPVGAEKEIERARNAMATHEQLLAQRQNVQKQIHSLDQAILRQEGAVAVLQQIVFETVDSLGFSDKKKTGE